MWRTASRPSAATPEPAPARREVLALIPARGGSKGVPRKNLRPLCGRPLIAYSIAAALAARLVTRVVVVTEDEEIAEVSRRHGAEVPFLRPNELAEDGSNLDDSFAYTLSRLRESGYAPDCVVFCFPTLPFRTPAFMDHMVGMLHRGHKNVLTVRRVERQEEYFRVDPRTGLARPVLADAYAAPCYKAFDVFSGYNVGPAPLPTYMHCAEDPAMCIDIDSPRDFALAEQVIRAGLFDFGLDGLGPGRD